jgi:hypothetical protein
VLAVLCATVAIQTADLIYPIFFAGHGGIQLMLDHQLTGWPRLVVTTSGKLVEQVRQVDFVCFNAQAMVVCRKLSRLARTHWTKQLSDLTNLLLTRFVTSIGAFRCYPSWPCNMCWLATQSVLKQHDATTLRTAARVVSVHSPCDAKSCGSLDGETHDVHQLALSWNNCCLESLTKEQHERQLPLRPEHHVRMVNMV